MKSLIILLITLAVVLSLAFYADARKNARNRKYDLNKKDKDLFKDWLRDRPEKIRKLKLSRRELIDRFRKFQANVKKVKALNAKSAGKTEFGLTDFSDLDENEFSLFTSLQQPARHKRDLETVEPEAQKRDLEALPASKDWRKSKRRVVGPVQNQGSCGSCWTFATAANIEGVVAKAGKPFLTLSEKHILDCVRTSAALGCKGGWMSEAYDYLIKNGGLKTDKYYPYKPVRGKCRRVGGPVAKISSWVKIPASHDQIRNALVTIGPLAVVVSADTWQHYRGGIFGSKCGTKQNHAVTLIGYGTKNGTPVWIIKNSWGTGWGVNGYAFIRRGASSSCGIHMNVFTAKV